MTNLRFRQIHLDFHTSQHITGIGDRFDPEQFADTLARAHVNSVTCFARCHHGYIYFDTQQFPERRHPHLSRNLLREQIEACHARNIRVPIYVTIQWDQYTAEHHPEWLAVNADGTIQGTPPFEAGFYRNLCVNSPYLYFLKAHIAEILNTLPVDGFFFDIVQPLNDASHWTKTAMIEAGLDPSNAAARQAYGVKVIADFQRDLTAFVRESNADCTIFYNAGHIGPRSRPIANTYSHFEIESLPSGGWGYAHFPLAARYARTLGREIMGMTGKFHTSWGDFHSFKTPEALQFECFHMLAMGAQCSIGDQLHPDGEICQTTYDLIGGVYAEVEAKEPWCVDAVQVAQIAVMTPEEWTGERIPPAAVGALRILQESGYQFDFIDSQADFSRYRLLILPDVIQANDALNSKLNDYLAAGGALIASYRSGEALYASGVIVEGEAPFSPDFIVPSETIGEGLPATELVMYMRGMKVMPQEGTTTLAAVSVPYFNRTWEHFCSHRHTPSARTPDYPAITRRGMAVYFAHPIFTQYQHNAPRWCKQLVVNAIAQLLPSRYVTHDGPSTLIVTLNEQAAQSRRVLHALHYIPTRTGTAFDTIEDVIPLYNVGITVHEAREVLSVTLVPDGDKLAFTQNDDDYVRFVIPHIRGHQMVEIAYEAQLSPE